MSRPASNLRVFIAIDPPEEIARALLDRTRALDLPGQPRLTPLHQVHMTLHFVGDTPASEMDATAESVRRAAAGVPAFSLELLRLITLPERGPARLVAAMTSAPPGLLEIQRRLVARLARKVRSRQGQRFTPHITLCRFASPRRFTLAEGASRLDGAFDVTAIRLMRSTLSQAGAVHHEVLRVELECVP